MAAINEKFLEDRLGTLEAARSWSPRVVSRLEALIRRAALAVATVRSFRPPVAHWAGIEMGRDFYIVVRLRALSRCYKLMALVCRHGMD
jgi:hypothetical protein